MREQAAELALGQQLLRDSAEHSLAWSAVPASAGDKEVGIFIFGEAEKLNPQWGVRCGEKLLRLPWPCVRPNRNNIGTIASAAFQVTDPKLGCHDLYRAD